MIGRFAVGFLAGVLVGGLALAAWFGYTGWQMYRDWQSLAGNLDLARTAAGSGDVLSAAEALPVIRSDMADLDARLSAWPWTWAQGFPAVGGSVQAASTLVSAAAELLAPSEGLGASVTAVATGEVDAGDLSDSVRRLGEAAPTLTAVAALSDDVESRVAALDLSSVHPRVRGRVTDAQQMLLGVIPSIRGAAGTAEVLPALLGMDRRSRWLVVLSQPAEARGSGGGFFGAFALVDAREGRLSLRESAANGRLLDFSHDLSGLPREYRVLWGDDATYLWGYNLTRHFPYAAKVTHRATADLGFASDFVVALDPRVVAALLQLAGPVEVEGIRLNSENAERYLTQQIYVDFPDATEKDRIGLALLDAIFDRLSATRIDPVQLWRALDGPIGQGRLSVWSADPDLQQALARTPLGGAVPDDPRPWTTVALNNSGGNKIDSYIDSKVVYVLKGSCNSGRVTGRLSATLRLRDLPPGLPGYISGRSDVVDAPYGTSSMMVHLYGPVGSALESLQVDGKDSPAGEGRERGHPVWGKKVQLTPGEKVTVTAEFSQPSYPGWPAEVAAQPMVRDTEVVIKDRRSCAAS